jgi:mannose PTS system EIIA component
MSVGLLILSHAGIGSAILGTAKHMINDSSMAIKLLTVEQDCEPNEIIAHARLLVEELDSGEGVLIVTDLFGSTPSNIAMSFTDRENVSAIAGLNLSMLIKIMNYHDLTLQELSEKAINGGKQGILQISNKN